MAKRSSRKKKLTVIEIIVMVFIVVSFSLIFMETGRNVLNEVNSSSDMSTVVVAP